MVLPVTAERGRAGWGQWRAEAGPCHGQRGAPGGPTPLLTNTAGLGAALRAGLPGAAGAGRCGGDGTDPGMGIDRKSVV